MAMKDVDHTHPHTNEPFGQTFYRGAIAADGGRTDDEQTMEDIHHEPPNEGATRTFERGTEGRDEVA